MSKKMENESSDEETCSEAEENEETISYNGSKLFSKPVLSTDSSIKPNVVEFV